MTGGEGSNARYFRAYRVAWKNRLESNGLLESELARAFLAEGVNIPEVYLRAWKMGISPRRLPGWALREAVRAFFAYCAQVLEVLRIIRASANVEDAGWLDHPEGIAFIDESIPGGVQESELVFSLNEDSDSIVQTCLELRPDENGSRDVPVWLVAGLAGESVSLMLGEWNVGNAIMTSAEIRRLQDWKASGYVARGVLRLVERVPGRVEGSSLRVLLPPVPPAS